MRSSPSPTSPTSPTSPAGIAGGILLLLLVLLARPVSSAGDRPVVAVFDLDSKARISAKLRRDLTDYLRAKLAEANTMVIVDKGEQEKELKRMLNEQKVASYKECVDEACQIPLGKELAAGEILRTKLSHVGDVYILSSERIDIATGGSAGAAVVKVPAKQDQLLPAIDRLVHRLTGIGPLEGGAGETVTLGGPAEGALTGIGGVESSGHGVVKFTSDPPGLKVWIGDRELGGVTPFEDFVGLGPQSVRMGGNPSYKDAVSSLTLKKEMTLHSRLIPRTGSVVVVARDDRGRLLRDVPLRIDGELVAKTPVKLEGVRIGERRFEVELKGGGRAEQRVVLDKEGTEVRVELVVTSQETRDVKARIGQIEARVKPAVDRLAKTLREYRFEKYETYYEGKQKMSRGWSQRLEVEYTESYTSACKPSMRLDVPHDAIRHKGGMCLYDLAGFTKGKVWNQFYGANAFVVTLKCRPPDETPYRVGKRGVGCIQLLEDGGTWTGKLLYPLEVAIWIKDDAKGSRLLEQVVTELADMGRELHQLRASLSAGTTRTAASP